jgi:hypothetical protein
MLTLRSPKQLIGPDLGVPSLTFRAWYEAQHGTGDISPFDAATPDGQGCTRSAAWTGVTTCCGCATPPGYRWKTACACWKSAMPTVC